MIFVGVKKCQLEFQGTSKNQGTMKGMLATKQNMCDRFRQCIHLPPKCVRARDGRISAGGCPSTTWSRLCCKRRSIGWPRRIHDIHKCHLLFVGIEDIDMVNSESSVLQSNRTLLASSGRRLTAQLIARSSPPCSQQLDFQRRVSRISFQSAHADG